MFLLFEVIVFFYEDLVVNYIFYILPNLFDLEKLLLLLNPNPLEVSLVNFVSLDLDFDLDYFRKLSNCFNLFFAVLFFCPTGGLEVFWYRYYLFFLLDLESLLFSLSATVID